VSKNWAAQNACFKIFFQVLLGFLPKVHKVGKKLGRVGRKLGSPKSVLLNFYPLFTGNSSKSTQNWAKNWADQKIFLKFS